MRIFGTEGSVPALPEPWATLRTTVVTSDYTLTPRVYFTLRAAFEHYRVSTTPALEALAPEYGSDEFLQSVDVRGELPTLPERVVEDYRELVEEAPDFATWLRPIPETNQSSFLIARWLCHLGAFRHPAVGLFIEHPTRADHLLVQVRGVEKAEAPGAFGLPAAGHIGGLTPARESLLQELDEELGLREEDVDELELMDTYNYRDRAAESIYYNIEFRYVFHCRLKPGKVEAVRFKDGEVAAVAVFTREALRALVNHLPDRVASGLSAALPLYRE